MANVTPNLIKIGQSNIKNPKKIVDTHDTNMEKIKVFITTVAVAAGIGTPTNERVYLESGVGAYNYTTAVTFTFVNTYTEKPKVTVSVEYSLADFPSPLVPAFQLVQTGGVYTGVIVTPHSDNLPAVATAYFHVHAECRGAVTV